MTLDFRWAPCTICLPSEEGCHPIPWWAPPLQLLDSGGLYAAEPNKELFLHRCFFLKPAKAECIHLQKTRNVKSNTMHIAFKSSVLLHFVMFLKLLFLKGLRPKRPSVVKLASLYTTHHRASQVILD